jgi:superkiller protein 3
MRYTNQKRIKIISFAFLLTAFLFCGQLFAQDEALSQDTVAASSFNMGIKALQDGDTTGAVTYYRAALAADENHTGALLNIGSIYFVQKKYVEAAKNFKKVTELDPTGIDGFSNYGKVLVVQKKYDDALLAYQAALDADGDYADAHKEIGKIYFKKAGQTTVKSEKASFYDESIKALNKYLEKDTSDHYSYYLLGMASKYKKHLKNAKANLQKAISLNANHFESRYNLANIYREQESFSRAIEQYESALKIRPKHWRCAYNLAVAVQSNDPEGYEASIAIWEKFLKLARKNPKARKYISTTEKLIKDLKEAKVIADEEAGK